MCLECNIHTGFKGSVSKNAIFIFFFFQLICFFVYVCVYFQPTPMSTFFQGYLGAVSSAVTIAVSSHAYPKLYYVI